MKICMLTTIHQPFDTRVFHKESKSLLKAGHVVTLIAPSDTASKNNVDGIQVITIKKPNLKILHPITMLRVFIAGLRQDCDVYHCHEPGSLFVCTLLKFFRRTKLVYDAHEHYPSIISQNTMFPKYLKQLVDKIVDISEKTLCKFTDIIITVNYSLEKRYEKIKDVVVLFNVPILELFNVSNSIKEKSILISLGNISEKRGFDKLLFSMKAIKNNNKNVKLLIVGKISDTQKFSNWVGDYIKTNGLEKNIEFIDWIPHSDVVRYIETSTVGIILFQPTHYNNLIGLPNKLFEYMACRIPVIASDFPEIHKVVDESNCGILVDPTNIQEITDAILWLLEHPEEAEQMGDNGRKAVEETYNWENMEKRLFKLYCKLE
ncbi:MAG: glycosyltransferase family 4 protein [Methanosarcinaceae archaeon]